MSYDAKYDEPNPAQRRALLNDRFDEVMRRNHDPDPSDPIQTLACHIGLGIGRPPVLDQPRKTRPIRRV